MKNSIPSTALILSAWIATTVIGVPVVASTSSVEGQETHITTGVVEKVDLEKGRIILAHDEVPSLKWPGMTMGFAVENKALLGDLTPGQEVEFGFIQGKGGTYIITEIDPR